MSIRFIVIVSFLCVAQSVTSLKADWINPTGAWVFEALSSSYVQMLLMKVIFF